MKTRHHKHKRSGFTLVELLVAMAITTLIVTVLVSITAIATDTWTRSRSELRASRQAKTMVDAMARDFESIVARRNNAFEWLVAKRPDALPGPNAQASTNAADLVFFTSAMDRYDGDLTAPDSKGDICGVGYLLEFKDPITGITGTFPTFVLNRLVVNPDEAFTQLLAKDNLLTAFDPFRNRLKESSNFICENVYQFTVVFHVEIPGKTQPVQITVGDGASRVTEFRLKGTGITTVGNLPINATADEVKAGRLAGVEISLTVLSDAGVNRIRRGAVPSAPDEFAKFLSANSFNYSKFIRLSTL